LPLLERHHYATGDNWKEKKSRRGIHAELQELRMHPDNRFDSRMGKPGSK
jgi:pyruvate formate-lyase activating enzyme-like uncharacterized protein